MISYETSEKKYSSAYIHRVGTVLVITLILGILGAEFIFLKITKLYEVEIYFDERKQLFLGLFITIMVMCSLWIFLTNKWKDWALRKVRPEDEEILKYKILESKESLLFKKWRDISKTNKILRVIGIILLIGGAYYGDNYRTKDDAKFESEGEYAIASIDDYTKKYKNKKMMLVAEFHYSVDSVEYFDESVKASGWRLFPEEVNGFSIEKGDQFKLLYQKSDPTHNRLEVQLPSSNVMNRYLDQTKERLVEIEGNQSYCNCLVDRVYEKYQLKGVATLYNQDVSYWDNENYNNIKYKLLQNKKAFKKIQQECSEEVGS